MENTERIRLDPPYKELVKVASGWDYNSTVEHAAIADILGVEYPSQDYYQNVESANAELIGIGKRLKNVKGVGYFVLNPFEQVQEAVYDAKKGVRRIKYGINNLHDAPVSQLNDTQKEIHENTLVSLSRVYVSAVSGITQIAVIAGIQKNKHNLLKKSND